MGYLAWLVLLRAGKRSHFSFDSIYFGQKVIADAIIQYHSFQVLVPSVQGFLRILSIQFPRNDLYLSALQNAVDDGAPNLINSSR